MRNKTVRVGLGDEVRGCGFLNFKRVGCIRTERLKIMLIIYFITSPDIVPTFAFG